MFNSSIMYAMTVSDLDMIILYVQTLSFMMCTTSV